MLPRTVDGMKHVCYFRQALALDERRLKFLPEYAYGGRATEPHPQKLEHCPPSDRNLCSRLRSWYSRTTRPPAVGGKPSDKKADRSQIESGVEHRHTAEVWFVGTHSDM